MYTRGPWVCLECNSPNSETDKRCTNCSASRFWYGRDAVVIEHEGKKIYSKVPTMIWHYDELRIFGNSNYIFTKCPKCELIMVHRDLACPHCKHVLSEEEIEAQEPLNLYKRNYYIRSTITCLFILGVLVYVFS